MDAPVLTAKARDLNFTTAGGVCGTIRLLKNIGGLWLLQACRSSWAAAGQTLDFDALLSAAADSRVAFTSLVDPDHHAVLSPTHMPAQIPRYCRRTSQPEPAGPAAHAPANPGSPAL